jgi:hypothetical protein
MSESVEEETKPVESEESPRRKFIAKQFQKGVSGNPSGRPRVEPRVRRYARKYDRKMCKTLAEIAQDTKLPAGERRRAAMDLIAVGSGRPALVQEIAGRNGEQLGPLVALNFGGGMQHGQLSPADAYRLMMEGIIEPSGDHPAFHPVIEAQPSVSAEKTEEA